MQGVRVEQVPVGTRVGEHIVDDEHGAQDGRGTIFVTAKHYEGVKAAARDAEQVTYSHR